MADTFFKISDLPEVTSVPANWWVLIEDVNNPGTYFKVLVSNI